METEAMTEQEFWQALDGLLEMGLIEVVQEDGEDEPRVCLTNLAIDNSLAVAFRELEAQG